MRKVLNFLLLGQRIKQEKADFWFLSEVIYDKLNVEKERRKKTWITQKRAYVYIMNGKVN